MNYFLSYVPSNESVDNSLYRLDPLSTIIKLAILSKKPINTKISIEHNVICFQAPGRYQGIARMVFRSNRGHLHFLNNPIQIACQCFLTTEMIELYPTIIGLFKAACEGIKRLIETYRHCPIMKVVCDYFTAMIMEHVERSALERSTLTVGTSVPTESRVKIYKPDDDTWRYTDTLIKALNSQWTNANITVVLNMIHHLLNVENATEGSLEAFMARFDSDVSEFFENFLE